MDAKEYVDRNTAQPGTLAARHADVFNGVSLAPTDGSMPVAHTRADRPELLQEDAAPPLLLLLDRGNRNQVWDFGFWPGPTGSLRKRPRGGKPARPAAAAS